MIPHRQMPRAETGRQADGQCRDQTMNNRQLPPAKAPRHSSLGLPVAPPPHPHPQGSPEPPLPGVQSGRHGRHPPSCVLLSTTHPELHLSSPLYAPAPRQPGSKQPPRWGERFWMLAVSCLSSHGPIEPGAPLTMPGRLKLFLGAHMCPATHAPDHALLLPAPLCSSTQRRAPQNPISDVYAHVTNEETEARGDKGTHQKLPGQKVTEMQTRPSVSSARLQKD